MQTQDESLKLKTPEEVIAEYNKRLQEEGIPAGTFVTFDYVELQENSSRLKNVKIIQCFQEDTLKTNSEQKQEYKEGYGTQYFTNQFTSVQRRTFALVGRTASKAIEEAGVFISQLMGERQELREELQKHVKAVRILDELVEGNKRGMDRLKKDYDQKHEQLMAAKESAKKYESDMAKLSKALGELKLKEILGDSNK